jgi:DNA mismatch repair protein MutH
MTFSKSSATSGNDLINIMAMLEGQSVITLAKQLNIDIEKSKNGQATLFKKFFANLNVLPKDSNTKIKVIRINPTTNKPWESISLCPIKLKEFELETWEQSHLKKYLSSLLVIPILSTSKISHVSERRVGKSFFWFPDKSDEAMIRSEWEMYQEKVKSGACKTFKTSGGKNVSSLPTSSFTNFIHMRPKAQNGSDFDTDSLGNKIVKQAFWLNSDYIRKIVDKSLSYY